MIEEYLEKLRAELASAGADSALIQDAQYDAEEYLHSESSENEGENPEDAVKELIENYGTPKEVAAAYLEAELTVEKAMRFPEPHPRKSLASRFFGVLTDPRTYGAFFYMFLSLVTGIAYFTLAVTGISLSVGLSIMIFGIPVILLFLSLIRGVSFLEGRVVEALLGVRMPRRPRVVAREGKVFERIKWWFTDRRTWTSLFYMLLQLPLGIAYFTGVITVLALSLAVIAAPLIQVLFDTPVIYIGEYAYMIETWAMPFAVALGVLSLLILLHIVRAVGKLHGTYAKIMLVGDIGEISK